MGSSQVSSDKSRPTSADIHNAREAQNTALLRLDKKAEKVTTAKGTRAKQAALKDLHAEAKKAQSRKEEFKISSKMTRGEKAVAGIMTVAIPPVGAGWTGGYKTGLVGQRRQAAQIIDTYASVQLSDFRDLS